MKQYRNLLMAFAFVTAIGGAYATTMFQTAFFDNNGTQAGGGTSGTITDPSSGNCTITNTGAVCLIGTEWAFDTSAHAVAAQGIQSGNPTGLLKRP